MTLTNPTKFPSLVKHHLESSLLWRHHVSHGCQTFLRSQEMGGASLACPETWPCICGIYSLRLWRAWQMSMIWPRDTRIKRSIMSHIDDMIGMMAYIEQHTDGCVT